MVLAKGLTFGGNLFLISMMTFTAKRFQNVLDVVKQWYDESFRHRLVNGQLALVMDENYTLRMDRR